MAAKTFTDLNTATEGAVTIPTGNVLSNDTGISIPRVTHVKVGNITYLVPADNSAR